MNIRTRENILVFQVKLNISAALKAVFRGHNRNKRITPKNKTTIMHILVDVNDHDF